MERTIPTRVVVITVSNRDGGHGDYLNNREYPDAIGWRVDDHGHLHIRGADNGVLGTVSAGRWVSVEHSAA